MLQRHITLTVLVPTPQNGQTHSNNSSAKLPMNYLNVFHHFVGLALNGSNHIIWANSLTVSLSIIYYDAIYTNVKKPGCAICVLVKNKQGNRMLSIGLGFYFYLAVKEK